MCLRAHSVLASGTAHRGTQLLHNRTGDVHPAPADCDWCVRHVCPAIVWLRWFRHWQFRFTCACSSRRRRSCMASKHCKLAEGMRCDQLASWPKGHPATVRITSRHQLLLSGLRRTALNLHDGLAHDLNPTRVQLAELLYGRDPCPGGLSEPRPLLRTCAA